MTDPQHESAEAPTPEPATDAKQGVNDPAPEDTDTDEPLTSL